MELRRAVIMLSPLKVKMSRTIDSGFSDFLIQISSSFSELKVTQSYLVSIEIFLRDNFGLSHFFPIGSFYNQTSIRGYSDIDYFACINPDKLSQNSGIALNQICNVLTREFSNFTISIDCPALKIIFSQDIKEAIEIVPAKSTKTVENGYHIYAIPDCLNGWRKANPEIYHTYVQEVNQKLDNKLKPLIRFVKAWKYYRQVPISSFYLELGVTKYAENKRTIIYDLDMHQFFLYLKNIELAAIYDSISVAGYANPCSTQVKLIRSLSQLFKAVALTEQALKAKEKGNIGEAFYWWNLLYNGYFSIYYR